MTERLAYLEAVVGADITQFRKSMRDIRNETGILSETVNGIGRVARTATFAISAPLATLGSFMTQSAAQFEGTMNNLRSITVMTDQDFKNLTQSVYDFGKTTTFGAQGASESIYEIFSAGVEDIPLAMEVMKKSTDTAQAGLADLTNTTNALTATMLAYGGSIEDIAGYSDVWTRMVGLGVGSLEDFMANSQKVLPLSNALGISFEDVGATAAYLSQQGGGAKKAMTALAMMESNLLKPTKALEAAYAKLGVATGTELIEKFGSVTEAVIGLREAAKDPTDFNKFFSKTGLEAALAITNNVDKARAAITLFHRDLDGATDRAMAEQMKSFSRQMELMQSAIGAVGIAIGNAIMPLLLPFIQGIRDLFLSVSEANPEIIQLGVALGAVAVILPPLVWAATALLNPLGLLLTAVAAFGGAVITDFEGFGGRVRAELEKITGDLQPLIDLWNEFWSVVFPEDKLAGMTDQTPMNPAMMTSPGTSTTVDIKPGWGLSHIYYNYFKDEYDSYADFAADYVKNNPIEIHPGEMVVVMGATNGRTPFEGGLQNFFNTGFDLKGSSDGLAGQSATLAENIFQRLSRGFDTIWPRLQAELDKIWINISTWFSTAMTNVGNLFVAGKDGDAPLYKAFKALLEGDLQQAVNEVVPGLGDQLAKAWDETELTGKLTDVGTKLVEFIRPIGDWFLNDAIPAISKSIGLFVGRLANFIDDAILMAVGGGGAALAYLGENVVSPFMEGYTEGITLGEENLKGTEAIGERILDILNTAILAGVTVSALTGKLAASGLLGRVKTAIVTALTGPVGMGIIIGVTVSWYIQEWLEKSQGYQDYTLDLTKRVKDALGMEGGYLTLPVGIEWAIESDDIRVSVDETLDNATFIGTEIIKAMGRSTPNLNFSGRELDWSVNWIAHAENFNLRKEDGSPLDFNDINGFLADALTRMTQSSATMAEQWGVVEYPLVVDPDFGLEVTQEDWDAFLKLIESKAWLSGVMGERGFDPYVLQDAFNIKIIPTVDVGGEVDNTDPMSGYGVFDASSISGLHNRIIAPVKQALDTAKASPELTEAAEAVGKKAMEDLGSAVTTYLDETGVVDEEKVRTSIVAPLATVFTEAFGKTGTVTTLFTDFVTEVGVKTVEYVGHFDTIASKAAEAQLNLPVIFQSINTALFPIIDNLIAKINDLKTAALDAFNAVGGFGSVGLAGVNMSMPGNSSVVPTTGGRSTGASSSAPTSNTTVTNYTNVQTRVTVDEVKDALKSLGVKPNG